MPGASRCVSNQFIRPRCVWTAIQMGSHVLVSSGWRLCGDLDVGGSAYCRQWARAKVFGFPVQLFVCVCVCLSVSGWGLCDKR